MACSKIQSFRGSNGAAPAALRLSLRRGRSVTLSLQSSSASSSSCSCSSSGEGDLGNLIGQRSVKKAVSVDGFFRVVGKDGPFAGFEAGRASEEKISKRLSRRLWKKMLLMPSKIKTIVLLNVATVIYASDITVVKEVETVMDPAAFAAVRFVMSAIPFLPFVFRAREDAEIRNGGIELGFWVSLGYLVEALGLRTSDASRASIISLFTVIVVPLLDGMLGAIIPARTWFGVLISVAGVAMLETSGSPPNVGDLLNFLSAIFFGIHMLRTEHISRCTKKDNLLALLGYEISVVAVLSTLWYLIGGWLGGVQDIVQSSWTLTGLWDRVTAFPWIPAVYTGIVSTGFCSWVEIAAMHDVSATETAIIYGLEPVWGAGFAWFLLGERWGTMGWIGAALVLGGSLSIQMFGSSTPDKQVENGDTNEDMKFLSAVEKRMRNTGPSASPVVVRSRRDVNDIL